MRSFQTTRFAHSLTEGGGPAGVAPKGTVVSRWSVGLAITHSSSCVPSLPRRYPASALPTMDALPPVHGPFLEGASYSYLPRHPTHPQETDHGQESERP